MDQHNVSLKQSSLEFLLSLVPSSVSYFSDAHASEHILVILTRLSTLLASTSTSLHRTCLSLICAIHHRSREILYDAMIQLNWHNKKDFLDFVSTRIPHIGTLLSNYQLQQQQSHQTNNTNSNNHIATKEFNFSTILQKLSSEDMSPLDNYTNEHVDLLHTLITEIEKGGLRSVPLHLSHQIYICLLELTREKRAAEVRELGLICLGAFLDSKSELAAPCLEITLCRLLQCFRENTPKNVRIACEGVMMSCLKVHSPIHICNVVMELLTAGSFIPSVSIQVKCITTLSLCMRRVSSSILLGIVPSFMKTLSEGVHSTHIEIRKEAVLALVNMYDILRDDFLPFLDSLPVEKVITLYINIYIYISFCRCNNNCFIIIIYLNNIYVNCFKYIF